MSKSQAATNSARGGDEGGGSVREIMIDADGRLVAQGYRDINYDVQAIHGILDDLDPALLQEVCCLVVLYQYLLSRA